MANSRTRSRWLLLPLVLVHLVLAACAMGPTPPSPVYAQPVAGQLVEAWAAGYQEYETTEERTFYRVFGGGASRLGAWMSPVPPRTTASVRADMALPPENTAEFVSIVTVPPGTRIRIGRAAPAFGQPGGGEQVQLLELIPPASFGEPAPLVPE